MYKTTAGGYALWLVILLSFGKIAATSLSIGIGGSGGGVRTPVATAGRPLSWPLMPGTASGHGACRAHTAILPASEPPTSMRGAVRQARRV